MHQLYRSLRCQLQKHAASQETWSINRAKIQISWSIILSYYHCVINQTKSESMVPHVTKSFPNLGVLTSQSLQQQLIDTICSFSKNMFACQYRMSSWLPLQNANSISAPDLFLSTEDGKNWFFISANEEGERLHETSQSTAHFLLQFKSISHWTTTYLLFNASNTVPSNAKANSTNVRRKNQVKIKCQELLIL
jgi:hypothetical protein